MSRVSTMARIEHTGSPDTNYFVCTLGEAASIKSGNLPAYKTINDFLDYQAQQLSDFPAVAFPIPSHDQVGSEEWESSVFSILVSP